MSHGQSQEIEGERRAGAAVEGEEEKDRRGDTHLAAQVPKGHKSNFRNKVGGGEVCDLGNRAATVIASVLSGGP